MADLLVIKPEELWKVWRSKQADTYDGNGHVHPPRELPAWAVEFMEWSDKFMTKITRPKAMKS
jgi:hypothetical protein